LPPSQASFQIPAGIVKQDGNYTLNVQLIETRGHVAQTAGNANIFRRSDSFFAFSPLRGGAPPQVLLPTVGPAPDPSTGLGPTYQFNFKVVAGEAIFIDPLVAIGYEYAIGPGDPNFASVRLPSVGDNLYTVSFLDGQSIAQRPLAANSQLFFPEGGVEAFSVTGIETSAGLDPNNVTAFVTALTFVGNGQFTGTMTPLITDTGEVPAPVPEPTTLLLFGTTAAGLGLARLRQRRRKQQP
jgi:hypothetical protein